MNTEFAPYYNIGDFYNRNFSRYLWETNRQWGN